MMNKAERLAEIRETLGEYGNLAYISDFNFLLKTIDELGAGLEFYGDYCDNTDLDGRYETYLNIDTWEIDKENGALLHDNGKTAQTLLKEFWVEERVGDKQECPICGGIYGYHSGSECCSSKQGEGE